MRKRATIVLAVVSVTAVLAAVLSVAQPWREDDAITNISYPTAAAHRGGSALHPENTLTAFKATARDHPGMPLEMDVMAIKNGTLVISHDSTVDRVAVNATGKVADMTREQWTDLRIKNPNGRDPAPASTLDEVIDEFRGTDTPLVIEIKNAAIIDSFIETVWPIREQVIAQSFNPDLVARFAKSGLHTLQLSTEPPVKIIAGVDHVGIKNPNITEQFVTTAHDQGVKVWAWGDDVTADMADTDSRGVDAFIANNPNR